MTPGASAELPPPSAHPMPANTTQADDAEKRERLARYSDPDFTRQLLEHMHLAKIAAILQDQQRPNQ
jgi:hypothetical protein